MSAPDNAAIVRRLGVCLLMALAITGCSDNGERVQDSANAASRRTTASGPPSTSVRSSGARSSGWPPPLPDDYPHDARAAQRAASDDTFAETLTLPAQGSATIKIGDFDSQVTVTQCGRNAPTTRGHFRGPGGRPFLFVYDDGGSPPALLSVYGEDGRIYTAQVDELSADGVTSGTIYDQYHLLYLVNREIERRKGPNFVATDENDPIFKQVNEAVGRPFLANNAWPMTFRMTCRSV